MASQRRLAFVNAVVVALVFFGTRAHTFLPGTTLHHSSKASPDLESALQGRLLQQAVASMEPTPVAGQQSSVQQFTNSPAPSSVPADDTLGPEGCEHGYLTQSRQRFWEYNDHDTLGLTDILVSQDRVYALFNAKATNRTVPWPEAQWTFIFHELNSTAVAATTWGLSPHGHSLSCHVRLPRQLADHPADKPLHVTIVATVRDHVRRYNNVPFCLYPDQQGTISAVPSSKGRGYNGFQYNLAACTEVVASTVQWVPEWIVYHQLQGFEHFYIYVNADPVGTQEILAPFIKAGLVTVVDWQFSPRYAGQHMHQQAQQNSCLYRARGRVRWLGMHDVDEFFQPLKEGLTVAQFLNARSKDEHIGAFRLQTWWFGPHKDSAVQSQYDQLAQNCLLKTAVWVSRADSQFTGGREKIIARPENIAYMSVHTITYGGEMRTLNPATEMRMVHYKKHMTHATEDPSMRKTFSGPIYNKLKEFCGSQLQQCCPDSTSVQFKQ